MLRNFSRTATGLCKRRSIQFTRATNRMNGSSVGGGLSPPIVPSAATSKPNDMKDEYGEMDCSGETFIAKNFVLESGYVLPEAHVRLDRDRKSVV